jgi:hypothetical protein
MDWKLFAKVRSWPTRPKLPAFTTMGFGKKKKSSVRVNCPRPSLYPAPPPTAPPVAVLLKTKQCNSDYSSRNVCKLEFPNEDPFAFNGFIKRVTLQAENHGSYSPLARDVPAHSSDLIRLKSASFGRSRFIKSTQYCFHASSRNYSLQRVGD